MLWDEIEALVPERLVCECYHRACEYFRHFYCGDWGVNFPPKKALSIVEEIKQDAKFYLRLKLQEEEQDQLKKDWPRVDAYIERLCERVEAKKKK